jgi:hypothetical protein
MKWMGLLTSQQTSRTLLKMNKEKILRSLAMVTALLMAFTFGIFFNVMMIIVRSWRYVWGVIFNIPGRLYTYAETGIWNSPFIGVEW